MYPNLFVIGAAKSGTSSLHYYLDAHPDVHMSALKEPHFFSALPGTSWPRHAIRDVAEYQSMFDTAAPVRGESSPTYSLWPHPDGVPERIREVAPDARFIYLVRDPVDRLISHYRHRVGSGHEQRPLGDVLADPQTEEDKRYLAASRYATQLERYLALFPPDRVLVLDQTRLTADLDGLMRQCFEFLGVDAEFTSPNWRFKLNDAGARRQFPPWVRRLRTSLVYRRMMLAVRPDVRERLVRPVRNLLTREVGPRPELTEVPPAVHERLVELLGPEAQRLRQLTGETFPSWSV